MASNDGRRLTVFGLTFRQYDNRQMQQILRQYRRLPSNPGNRAVLYTSLFDLSINLDDIEAHGIETWLRAGGVPDDFPQPPRAATPPPMMSDPMDTGRGVENDEEEGSEDEAEEEWQDYNPADFEVEGEEIYGEESREGDDLDRNPDLNEFHEWGMQDNDPEGAELPAERQNLNDDYEDEKPAENECGICLETVNLLAPTMVTSTCDHDHDMRACFPCLERSMDSDIQDGNLSSLRCPFCPEKMSTEEVRKYSSDATFARYEYLILMSNPDIVMCLGPSCGSGQIHTDTSEPKMVCYICSFATCVRHKVPWHEGQTCDEFECSDAHIEQLEQAELTAKLLARDQAQICPSCKQGVTKQDGCDHMSCRCGHAWCFICLASYENTIRFGAEAHARFCTYHPRTVSMTQAEKAAGQVKLAETVLGGPASEALLRARDARNERVRVELRPKAAEAAEARMKAIREREMGEGKSSAQGGLDRLVSPGDLVNEALSRARTERAERENHKIADAVEARMAAEGAREKDRGKPKSPVAKKRKVRLFPAWEER